MLSAFCFGVRERALLEPFLRILFFHSCLGGLCFVPRTTPSSCSTNCLACAVDVNVLSMIPPCSSRSDARKPPSHVHIITSKVKADIVLASVSWWRGRELNSRSLAYETGLNTHSPRQIGAPRGTRTPTLLYSHRFLRPVCLPIPSAGHVNLVLAAGF